MQWRSTRPDHVYLKGTLKNYAAIKKKYSNAPEHVTVLKFPALPFHFKWHMKCVILSYFVVKNTRRWEVDISNT